MRSEIFKNFSIIFLIILTDFIVCLINSVDFNLGNCQKVLAFRPFKVFGSNRKIHFYMDKTVYFGEIILAKDEDPLSWDDFKEDNFYLTYLPFALMNQDNYLNSSSREFYGKLSAGQKEMNPIFFFEEFSTANEDIKSYVFI